MITFPDLYITHIGPTSLTGIKLINGVWCDIMTSEPVSDATAEKAAMSSIMERYPDTDRVAFAAKVQRYRREAN